MLKFEEDIGERKDFTSVRIYLNSGGDYQFSNKKSAFMLFFFLFTFKNKI